MLKILKSLALFICMAAASGCNATIVSGEQYQVPVSSPTESYTDTFRLHLIKHNRACDGMGLRLYIDDRANYERRIGYEVYTMRGQWLGDGFTNSRGETAIDFRGHNQVVVVFNSRIAQYYRRYGARPAVLLGSWERWQNRPVWVHGTIPLSTFMRAGYQQIDLRAGRRFCR